MDPHLDPAVLLCFLHHARGHGPAIPAVAHSPVQPGQPITQNLKTDPKELFTKLEKTGKSSFGEVVKGIDSQIQKVVAIKFSDLEEAEDDTEDIQQEIIMLSQCNSPYITNIMKDTSCG